MSKLKREKYEYEFNDGSSVLELQCSGGITVDGCVSIRNIPELIEVLQRYCDTNSFVKKKFTAHEIAPGKYGEYGVLESGSNWLKFGGAIQEFSTKEDAQRVADALNAQE